MYEQCPVSIRMKHMLLEGGFFDEARYNCRALGYEEKTERLYLEVADSLPIFSLDAQYECQISESEESLVVCEGEISERYWREDKNIIVVSVDKGFYKNPIN